MYRSFYNVGDSGASEAVETNKVVINKSLPINNEVITKDNPSVVDVKPNSSADLRQINVVATSYNPQAGQTDNSPCKAAGGHDICQIAREGGKVIAVSRDLRQYFLNKKGSYYQYPAQVYVESQTEGVTGCYWIYDTMNARFTKRIDLFYMDKKDNKGKIKATISNKLEYCNK